jgi:tripartite ATP-independent transporter DctP family solute receptor
MKRYLKVTALVLTFLLVFALTGCGGGNEAAPGEGTEAGSDEVYKIIFSHANAKGASVHDAVAEAMKEYVEKESGGRLQMEIYPDGQLGLDREVIEAVQAGTITMMGCSSAVQANFVPSAAIFDCPFAVNSIEAGYRMVTDETMLSALGKEYENAGLKHMFLINGGFRNTSSKHKIAKPEDFKNFKIRVMENPIHIGLWKALGANPTPIAASELYTALQQGVVEGQENAYDIAYYYAIQEVNKYFSEDCHILAVNSYIVNKDFYDGLPADLRKVLDEGMEYGRQKGQEASDFFYYDYRQKILDAGCEIYTWPAKDVEVLKEKTAEIWDMVRNTKGMNPEVFEAFVAACDKANSAN